MELEPNACYRIIQARDARFDGKFFTGVTSTGIYCRPICPARTPKRENVRFFSCAAAAEAAGFRACKRCRPETAPGTPAWNGTATTVRSALRFVAGGFLDEHPVTELATLLGMGERHLRRLFVEHLGVAPAAIALSRRAHFAARMLRDTDLPVSHVALSAGFGSIRQFNDVFRLVFGEPPGAVRRAHVPAPGSRPTGPRRRRAPRSIELSLAYRPPFQWERMLDFLRVRAVRGVEEVSDRAYRRSISVGSAVGTLEVSRKRGGGNAVSVSITGIEPALLGETVRRVRRMFDLDADPLAIGGHLRRDTRLAPLVRAAPGMRIPVTWDPFEAAVRAVIGQQISVAGAITIAGRLAERHGRPLEGGGSITRVFPGPADLAQADLSGLGVPASRTRTLATVANAVLAGRIRLDGYAQPEQLSADLVALPGIGPWSAQYIAMRGFGEPDAFPETDLGIRKALDSLGYPRSAGGRKAAMERLSPWRGYAALYLWSVHFSGG
jgi:AraC family transcriptional regulator, regulatory protein of adaptative response / DNA-3-methyladenine glycosylase II